MKVKIEIELDGTGRDVAALKAITAAIANLPPADLEIYPSNDVPAIVPPPEPTKVQVWTKTEKAAEAAAEVVTAPNVEIEAKSADVIPAAKQPPAIPSAPPVTPVDNPTDEDKKAAMARLRQLVLDAAGLPGLTPNDARNYALDSVGKKDVKQFTYEDVLKATAAMEAFIAERK